MLGGLVKFVVGAALVLLVSGCAVGSNSSTFAIKSDASLGDVCRPINGVQRAFATSRLVMFGEVHGTREMPTFVGDAACHAVRDQCVPVYSGVGRADGRVDASLLSARH